VLDSKALVSLTSLDKRKPHYQCNFFLLRGSHLTRMKQFMIFGVGTQLIQGDSVARGPKLLFIKNLLLR